MGVTVTNNLQGDPVMREDLGGIKFGNAFGVNGFLAGDKDTGFANVMICDCQDGVEAL